MRPRRAARKQSGQAIIETAVVFAVVVLMLAGAYAVGTLANDQNTATTSVRAGGRFAAELGNGSSLNACSPACNPVELPVDSQVVGETCRIMITMPDLVSITNIIVYKPQTNANGSYNAASDPSDVYAVNTVTCAITSGTTVNGGYPLANRNQTHPSESQVGIYVQYLYKSPTPFFQLSLQATDYTVITVAPSNV